MRLSRLMPVASAVLGAVLLAGCGAGAAPGHPARTAQPEATVTSAPSSTAPRSTAPPSVRPSVTAPPSALPVAPGAGARPQTHAYPSTHSTAFRNAMTDLWLAVTTGNPRLALPAFFPLAAYQQVKAIPYPAADWHDRLWHDFTLDVGAAHELVGSHARLVRVIVPTYDAVWGPPVSALTRSATGTSRSRALSTPNTGRNARSASLTSSPGAGCGTWCTSARCCAAW